MVAFRLHHYLFSTVAFLLLLRHRSTGQPAPLAFTFQDTALSLWSEFKLYGVVTALGDERILSYDGTKQETWLLDTSRVTDTLQVGSWMWEQIAKTSVSVPSKRTDFAMASLGGGKALLFGGKWGPPQSINTSTTVLSDTWMLNLSASGGTWTQIGGVAPAGRNNHAMAMLGNNLLVLYGGSPQSGPDLSDTWVFDLNQVGEYWTEVKAEELSVLPVLVLPAMAPLENNCVLLLGSSASTYKASINSRIFNNTNKKWTEVPGQSEQYPPMPPNGNSLVAVGRGQAITVTQSSTSTGQPYYHPDVWYFNNGAWNYPQTWQTPEDSLSIRIQNLNQQLPLLPLFTNSSNPRVLMFGVSGVKGVDSASSWIWTRPAEDPSTTNPWTQVSDAPMERESHAMCSIGDQSMLLFGGLGEGGAYLDDTWVLKAPMQPKVKPRWERQSSGPPGRQNSALAYLNKGKAFLFGGHKGSQSFPYIFNDAWIFQVFSPESPFIGGKWSQISNNNNDLSAPSARTHHAMSSLTTGKILLYGGTSTISAVSIQRYTQPLTDSWIFELSENGPTWTKTTDGPTRGRFGHALANIKDGAVLLYGGIDHVSVPAKQGGHVTVVTPQLASADSWVFELSENQATTWKKINTTKNPPARALHAMAPFNNGRVLLFGGCSDCTLFPNHEENYNNDQWIFFGTGKHEYQWEPIDGNYMYPRASHTMAVSTGFASMSPRIYVFGGLVLATDYSSSKAVTVQAQNDLWYLNSGCVKGYEGAKCTPCVQGTYSSDVTPDNTLCNSCPNGTTTRLVSGSWFLGDCNKCAANNTIVTHNGIDSGGVCTVSFDDKLRVNGDGLNWAALNVSWQCFGHTWGSRCQQCPGMRKVCDSDESQLCNTHPCSGHGICSVGIRGTGKCFCKSGYIHKNCSVSCGKEYCNKQTTPRLFGQGGSCVDPWVAHRSKNVTWDNFKATCACDSFLYNLSPDCSVPVTGILLVVGLVFVVLFVFLGRRYVVTRKEKLLVEDDLHQQEIEYQLLDDELGNTQIELGNRDNIITMQRQTMMIDESDLIWNTRLAAGGYGEVWLGKWKVRPNEDVAIKKMFINAENIDMCLDGEIFDDKEINVLMRAGRHARVVMFYGAGQLQDKHIFLVTEFMQGGDLFHRLSNGQTFEWSERQSILSDIAAGMKQLHSQEMLHRDLKSMNILLDKEGRAKIADFGLSKFTRQKQPTKRGLAHEDQSENKNEQGEEKQVPKGKSALMTYGSFSIPWTPPEMLKRTEALFEGRFMANYGLSADVYSFAVVGWEMMARKIPWDGMEEPVFQNIAEHVLAGKRPMISHEMKEEADAHFPELMGLVTDCWNQEPNSRPTFDEVFEVLKGYHRW